MLFLMVMRTKELRLALVCYGGVSLAVYMHGIVKEVWKLLQASRAHSEGGTVSDLSDTAAVYAEALADLLPHVRLRVLTDIIAGASAGGINGIFLGHAIATGADMEPLRDLWLENADIEKLLDPVARPHSSLTKLWATPIAWAAARRPDNAVDKLVEPAAREEVRHKLSRFVRSRWFEPPFGGETFTGLLLDAFDAMDSGERGPTLIPPGQPLDLFVTVTDLVGYPQQLRLHSPPQVEETEHRLTLSFSTRGHAQPHLGETPDLLFAARATASFPGAFPPFNIRELDNVLAERRRAWPGRQAFLARAFPHRRVAGLDPEKAILIDGSVLANAPFRPAIDALRERPAHHEVDRRFVYIDPRPGRHSVSLTGEGETPGFFSTMLKAVSDLPREQPIRDNLETIEKLSRRIRDMRIIVHGMRPEVDAAIERELGGAFFLGKPSLRRLAGWRNRAQTAAAREAGYAFAAYGHQKLVAIFEELSGVLLRGVRSNRRAAADAMREALDQWATRNGLDHVAEGTAGATDAAISFFRRFDLGFRIRRLRLVARRLVDLGAEEGADVALIDSTREAIYECLAAFLELRRADAIDVRIGTMAIASPEALDEALEQIARAYNLTELDATADARLCELAAALPRQQRRQVLLSYLGFPFYDIATLPLLQGEGLDEFDPIKVDRVAPDDARTLRSGGADATLKGIQFNSFGAFFSRAYRENDYLWGRLHGAERMIDILMSTLPEGAAIDQHRVLRLKQAAFRAIVEAERPHLGLIGDLLDSLMREIG